MEDAQNGVQGDYIPNPKDYALSGKILLSAIVILFTVVLLILCLHIYTRCFLPRRRRNHLRRRAANFIFSGQQQQNRTSVVSFGLEVSVLRSLPVFVFSTKTHQGTLECAVCLSAFEENENGRLLPNCKHSFHIDCIDMWFHSHSTCPLCRALVKTEIPPLERILSRDKRSATVSSCNSITEIEYGEDQVAQEEK
ncbi:RING-H2 finger protein ATL2-like [Tasmannia lanceolata]|uniref:RING-H2 finger protein ATL2-like n=1 Tax=Tasmannia lanceolata TaxID=3420 RepID=UPI004063C4C9